MGNSKCGNCPWTTVYNVHGICPLFHEEMLEKFHGQCPQYPGHCPLIPWTLSTHSMGSMDIVHTFHRFHGQSPLIPWKMSRMSMESMDFLQTGPYCFIDTQCIDTQFISGISSHALRFLVPSAITITAVSVW